MLSRLLVASSFAVAAHCSKLKVTWSDCGSKHSKITKLEPLAITTGTKVTLTGTGTVDEDVTAAKVKATVKEGLVTVSSCSGDAKSDIVCKLPLGAGSITVKKLPFPLKKGGVSMKVNVVTIASLPAALKKVAIHVSATDQKGESVVCLDAHTAPAASVNATVGVPDAKPVITTVADSVPNGIGCDVCKSIMKKGIEAGVTECKSLCQKAGSLDGICEKACDMISSECNGSIDCAAKVCGLVKLCGSEVVV